MLRMTFHVLLQRKPRGCFCPPTPPLHYGRGTREGKIAEHDSQCLTHRVGFKNRWVRKPTGKITYLTVGLNITIIAHSISQISMSVMHRTTHVLPVISLCVEILMDRTIASAKMDL